MDHGVVLLAAFAGGAGLFVLITVYKALTKKGEANEPVAVVVESKPVEKDEASLQQMTDRAGRPPEPICDPACGNPRCMLCFGGDGSKDKLGNVKFDLLALDQLDEFERAKAKGMADRTGEVLDSLATKEEPLTEEKTADLNFYKLHKVIDGPSSGPPKHDCPMCAAGLKPKERYYFNTIVKDQNGEPKAVVLDIGKETHEKLFKGVLHDVHSDYFKPSSPLERMQRVRTQKAKDSKPEVSDWWRPSGEGRFVIRLLPAAPSLLKTKTACVVRKQHYLGGYGGGNVVACLKTKGADGKWHGECPICDHWKHLWAMYDIHSKKGDWKTAEKYRSEASKCKGMERHYYNVLVYEPNGVVRGPLIWSTTISCQEKIQFLSKLDPSDDGCNYELFNPQMAHNLKIVRTQKGNRYNNHPGWPSYDISASFEAKPIGDDAYTEAVLANLWDLEVVADTWVKTPVEMMKAMSDAGILPIATRKCKGCDDTIRSHQSGVHFCKTSCLVAHKAGLQEKHLHCCPLCGEQQTKKDGNMLKYVCGFQSDADRVNSKCSAFPACSCASSKINQSPRGCKCGSRCEAIAQQPQETVTVEEDLDGDFLRELAKM